MLLTQLKGAALSLGTLGVIVSGAVVLGQSNRGQARPMPLPPTQEIRKDANPDRSAPPTSDDRTEAVERKLDRILKALDRIVGDPPSAFSTVVSAPFGQTATVLTQATRPPSPPVPLDELPGAPPQGASISQRLACVETALGLTEGRLRKLEARLTGLEKHVGVTTEGAVPGSTEPTSRPAN